MFFRGTFFRLIIILFLLVPLVSMAREKLVLTLEKSVDLALKNNPEMKMAEKELSKSKAGIWEAYSNILPQLTGSANFQKSWEIQENTMPNFIKTMLRPQPGTLPPEIENIFTTYTDAMPDFVNFAFGLENTLMYGASVTQPLFLGGAGIAGVQISYAARRAAEQNLEMKRQNLIYQSVNAFYTCILTKEVTTVQEEALAQAQANLDVVLKKYAAGAASGFDKMRAEVEVANLKPSVINARNGLNSAKTMLRNVLGLEKDVQIDVDGQLEFHEDVFSEKTLAEIQKMTLEKRPEIHAIDEQKYIAKKGLCIARSNFLPKIFFQTDYSFIAMKNDMKFAQHDFNKGFTSSVGIQIPLFTSFKNSAQYQKAHLDFKMMQDTEKQVSDGLMAESEVVYNSFQEARQKHLAAEQSVGLAEEALRLANMMYEEGANTQLDVLNSQLALTRAKLNYVSSLYEYQMARYQLRKVTGTLKDIL